MTPITTIYTSVIGRRPDMKLLEVQDRLIANCGERLDPPCYGAFRSPGDHVQKKYAHVEEQQRRTF